LLSAGIAMVFAGAAMAASITLSGLTHTYNGSPKSATVTTSPVGVPCTVTYAGSTTPPTNAGSYAVVATANPPETGSATGTLVISKANQTITFSAFSKTYGDAPFTMPGTSSSGLPLSYTSSNTTIATISGTTATILKAGATNITARQLGDSNYNAATQVAGILTVNKKTLSFSPVVPSSKTYGDAPFTVSATVSDGFSITKWESADPTVATISATGEVTIVGAGQTSIIGNIPSTAATNYDPTWVARPLNVARSAAALPSGTQTVTYNGSGQGLIPSALPSGQATEITYRAVPEATATPVVVFQNGPDNLALSYSSFGFQSSSIWSQAKYVELSGTGTVGAPRKLHSCDVTLSSYAPYNSYTTWAAANPGLVVLPPATSIPGDSGGYYHPVTLSFYEYEIANSTESYRLLTSKTVQAFIPWRPVKLADGVTNYTNQGYAFRVPFDFPDGVILPDQVWVAVSFNTQSFGVAPIGVSGPYDALNVPYPDGQLVGTTLTATKHYFFENWRWQQATQTAGPMLRLRTVPTNATFTAPVNAGTYEVKTKATAFGTDGSSTSTLVINKAPLAISLTNLTQVRDGSPKPVTVNTTPSGIATSTTYSGSATAPSALGSYPVVSSSANSNYDGTANGTLRIGDNYASWRNAAFAGSGLPPEQITDSADPDGDGLRNFLEYAFNLNPLLGNQPSPTGFESGDPLAFTYRRYMHALDVNYSIQGSTNLADTLSWIPLTPLGETILSDDGTTRVIRATVAKPANQPSYFLRMKLAPP
jgi:hypothetical protein